MLQKVSETDHLPLQRVGRLSGGVLCDVPSVAVSGETSATSVDMEGTYVPRVTVAQKC